MITGQLLYEYEYINYIHTSTCEYLLMYCLSKLQQCIYYRRLHVHDSIFCSVGFHDERHLSNWQRMERLALHGLADRNLHRQCRHRSVVHCRRRHMRAYVRGYVRLTSSPSKGFYSITYKYLSHSASMYVHVQWTVRVQQSLDRTPTLCFRPRCSLPQFL